MSHATCTYQPHALLSPPRDHFVPNTNTIYNNIKRTVLSYLYASTYLVPQAVDTAGSWDTDVIFILSMATPP